MSLPSVLLGILTAAAAAARLLKPSPQETNSSVGDQDETQRQYNEHIRALSAEIAGIRSEIQKQYAKSDKTKSQWAYDIVMLAVIAIGTGAAIYTLDRLDASIRLSERQMDQ